MKRALGPFLNSVQTLSSFHTCWLVVKQTLSLGHLDKIRLAIIWSCPLHLIRRSSKLMTIDSQKCQVLSGMWRGSVYANPSRSSHQLLPVRVRSNSIIYPHLFPPSWNSRDPWHNLPYRRTRQGKQRQRKNNFFFPLTLNITFDAGWKEQIFGERLTTCESARSLLWNNRLVIYLTRYVSYPPSTFFHYISDRQE